MNTRLTRRRDGRLARVGAVAAWLLLGVLTAAAAENEAPPAGAPGRVPWTSSNFRGRPEPPPPYRAECVFPHLRFDKTTVLAVEPASGRFFVGQRDGKVFVLPEDHAAQRAELFFDAAAQVERLQREGQPPLALDALYGLTFDPDFEQNRLCYVCYVVRPKAGGQGQLPDGTRVSRFRVSRTEPPRCEPDSEQLIIAWLHGGHNGGCLKFGPDGYLYISSGDGGFAFPPDGLSSGQDLSTLLSKVLRIDVRRQEQGRAYAIPPDNPFVALENTRGETWAYGLRNPWKMSFDRQTGELWVGDVGWELWELVYRVGKGDNFGWSIVEGRQPVHTERPRGPTPIVPPSLEIPHTDGASITGGFVYRGRKFPDLDGTYVFGDWETRRVWGAKCEGDKLGAYHELIDPTIRIVDFAEDRAGELYLLDHDDGAIYTLARNDTSAAEHPFPRRLSETGLFQSVASHEPAPGVLYFSVNAEQWSDHATAQRMIGVPGSETIRVHPRPRLVPGSQFSRATDFPRDTVLAKTLWLEMVVGEAASRRRVETQTLHFDGRDWQAYTYEWNDEQTDALLVEKAGKSRTFSVADPQAPGGSRTHAWRFASRGECLRCHNPWSEYTLAFNLPQLNRPHDDGSAADNQIRTLAHVGLLELIEADAARGGAGAAAAPSRPETLPRLAPPFDPEAPLEARARSYLHVNCAHCHRFNGGGSSYLYLQHDLPLAKTSAIGQRPTQGTFGIHDARLVAPGDPYRSILYYRLAKFGPGHMPHLGAAMIDERGLQLIGDWIRQLPPRMEDAARLDRLIELDRRRVAERRALVAELLADASRALMLVEAIRQKRLSPEIEALVIQSAVAADVDPAVRDLFEPFLPDSQRTRRLGDAIHPAEILALAGDVERGRRLFHESSVVQCRNCHRIAGRGTELGPDLDAIGKKLDRPKLLDSILQPSQQIDPKYTAWLVETSAGTVHVGLLLERSEQGVVLKDAQNKIHRLAAGDIERLVPQARSLMPDVQLRDWTAQQVADLLAYLASLGGPM